jgi:hypothetical membrane protein
VITLAVLGAIEKINPNWVQKPTARSNRALTLIGGASIAVALASIFIASTNPDALESIQIHVGATPAAALLSSPFADYRFASFVSDYAAKAFAGLFGLALVYFVCSMVGRAVAQRRSA